MTLSVACIQLTCGADMAANIARVQSLVAEAAARGAQLVALPENAFLMQEQGAKSEPYAQSEHPGVKAAEEMARGHGIWLLVGSVAVRGAGDSQKNYNRSLLFDPRGELVAHYDKIHLFDVEVGDGQAYRESAKVLPGGKAVVAKLGGDGVAGWWGDGAHTFPLPHHSTTPPLCLGLTICYDVRFPQLYRALAKAGAEIMAVPAAFTQVTGEAHWHVLLRARAIENGCFVIAPAQCGEHPGGRRTFGHSLIVDPWGKVLADGGTEEGVVMAEIDLSQVGKVRGRLPSLEHDRPFGF